MGAGELVRAQPVNLADGPLDGVAGRILRDEKDTSAFMNSRQIALVGIGQHAARRRNDPAHRRAGRNPLTRRQIGGHVPQHAIQRCRDDQPIHPRFDPHSARLQTAQVFLQARNIAPVQIAEPGARQFQFDRPLSHCVARQCRPQRRRFQMQKGLTGRDLLTRLGDHGSHARRQGAHHDRFRLGVDQRRRGDPGLPWRQKQPNRQAKHRQRHRQIDGRAGMAAQFAPGPDFLQHRQQDEVQNFDHEQQDAERLEEQVIDQKRDAKEQEEPVDPGAYAIDDQQSARRRIEMFRCRKAEPEKGFAHPPPRQGEGARLKVRHVQPVGQDVIAVEPQEGTEIDQQRRYPGRAGQQEHRPADRSVRQEGPQKRRQQGNRQFDPDPRCPDRQTRPARCHAPGVRRVGIENRIEHQKGDPHGRDPTAIPGGRIGMPQFMQDLGQGQGDCDRNRPLPVQVSDEGRGKGVPLTADQKQSDHAQAQDHVPDRGTGQDVRNGLRRP